MSPATPVAARPVADVFADDTPPGGFAFLEDDARILYACPCGCGQMIGLPIVRAGEPTAGRKGVFWIWDGNRERPSLTPSIRRLDACWFHGFLTAGTWTFCADSGQPL